MSSVNSLAKEVFDLVVRDCTWGNSKVGGPVWVLDFRIESLKKRFSKHQVIRRSIDVLDEDDCCVLSLKLVEIAETYVYYHQICNVMVIKDSGHSGTRVYFYSLLSFLRLLNKIFERGEVKGAPLSQISYILEGQNKAIKNDDYIWRLEWWIKGESELSFPDFERRGYGVSDEEHRYMFLPYCIPQFVELRNIECWDFAGGTFYRQKWCYTKGTMMVERVYDWEVYVPLVIYDMMELVDLNYFKNFRLPETINVQYPLICYGRAGRLQSCLSEMDVINMPLPKTEGLLEASWHKRFVPAPYWTMKDFPEVGRFIF